MKMGIRSRLLGWLILVVLPILAAAWIVLAVLDVQLSDRIETDLANTRRLEAARIVDALDDYQRDAMSLASGAHVYTFVGALEQHERGELAEGQVIGGMDGFEIVNPAADLPLQELAAALQAKAQQTGSEVVELRLVGRDGQVHGTTPGFSWEPYDPSRIERAMITGEPMFGNAFRAGGGDDRLGLVAPIRDPGGVIVGALILETRLGPIVDLVVEHEGFGETSEAHIAQPTPEGDAEFITLLRFKRDAAFTVIVPAAKDLPINRSLQSPGGQVVRSPDYRGIESILAIETIAQTGWGLVVKIDAAEAFSPIQEVKRVVETAALIGTVIIVIGWLTLVQPIGRRLSRAARAAERIAGGDYQSPIDDRRSDEIGDMARSIDRLATDLDEDIKIRAAAERRLQHQADHDDLTGLCNRQHATAIMKELFARSSGAASSLLYLDIDGFKDINDTYGHRVGDEVLLAVARRLSATAARDATVARWGGDEFVIILAYTDLAGALTVADRVRNLFADPIATSAGRHFLRCSVGAATSSKNQPLDEVLHKADSAMFAEKQQRTGLRTVSSTALRTVEHALEEDRIEVWYQPMIGLSTGGELAVAGVEALVRLRTPDGGLLPPFDFVPDVQHKQLGVALDRRVMTIAMSDTARWLRQGLVGDEFKLAVNVGSASIQDTTLASSIATRSADLGLQLGTVVVEISEETALLDRAVIEELRSAGVALAVDDVGLHHSNLDRLVEVRPDIAKIDRRWLGDPSSTLTAEESIVLSRLIQVCRGLGMTIVAEGVETPGQLELVKELGVFLYQGYYFDPPQPSVDFEANWCGRPPAVLH